MSSSPIGPASASSAQLSLELLAPPATAETPLVPVRMVNEFVYCPRLAFLEWVDSEWADSGDTEPDVPTALRAALRKLSRQ